MALAKTLPLQSTLTQAVVAVAVDPPGCAVAAVAARMKVAADAAASDW
jgi:hypothetical protein